MALMKQTAQSHTITASLRMCIPRAHTPPMQVAFSPNAGVRFACLYFCLQLWYKSGTDSAQTSKSTPNRASTRHIRPVAQPRSCMVTMAGTLAPSVALLATAPTVAGRD